MVICLPFQKISPFGMHSIGFYFNTIFISYYFIYVHVVVNRGVAQFDRLLTKNYKLTKLRIDSVTAETKFDGDYFCGTFDTKSSHCCFFLNSSPPISY